MTTERDDIARALVAGPLGHPRWVARVVCQTVSRTNHGDAVGRVQFAGGLRSRALEMAIFEPAAVQACAGRV